MRWHVIALWAIAESLERTHSIPEAIDTFREAERSGRAMDSTIFAVVAETFLAKLLNDHGQRWETVAVCEEAIERSTDHAGRTSPIAGMVPRLFISQLWEEVDSPQRHSRLGVGECREKEDHKL